jgi:uncharacterized protein YraI
MIRTKLTIAAFVATAAVLATGSAFAASAVATGTVNVRSGPGIEYAKISTLQKGTLVDVTECDGGFCFVEKPGTDGWVSASYLGEADDADVADADIPVNFGMSIGPGGPSFSMSIGDAPAPLPLPVAPTVCFFKSSNFNNASFCATPGMENDQLVGGWDDNISSISVEGGAGVTVCKSWWFGGGCTSYANDKPTLSASWNNKISSFQVY